MPSFDPSEIICLDVNEEKIYNLEQSALQKDSNIIFKTVLGSINCKDECEKVFNENRPQIVFHAAAYKHVPYTRGPSMDSGRNKYWRDYQLSKIVR